MPTKHSLLITDDNFKTLSLTYRQVIASPHACVNAFYRP